MHVDSSRRSQSVPSEIVRTLATGFQRLGVRFEVTEAVLNQVGASRSGVADIYQRHDWNEEKREALRVWNDHIVKTLAANGAGAASGT